MHPGELFIKDFTYNLPDYRIAQYPLNPRDTSQLLVYKQGQIESSQYKYLSNYLPANSLLVFNNSRVIEARIFFRKETGGKIEIFALEPDDKELDITQAMGTEASIIYRCMVGGAAKWKPGIVLKKQVETTSRSFTLLAENLGKVEDTYRIRFAWQPRHLHFAEVLHEAGEIPIPPYLQRQTEAADAITYQTIYARANGSVAAPTAGLHFTKTLLQDLENKKMGKSFLTLHVGAGTFLPVKTETISGHQMHAEFIEADEKLLRQLMEASTVIPVGTTSMRTLESLYWMGVKAYYQPSISLPELEMKQWEVYEIWNQKSIPRNEALQALLHWLQKNKQQKLVTKTHIIIAPGYSFGICQGLITNFHQPQSTLLLLVSALIGENWREVYNYALENEYRFLSYGDGSLLLP
jgi:S-adenosylmethionine:tRNA ribosyltransferase-isomerase